MNIKRNISKLVSGLLCFSMIFSNVLPAYAADAVITENTLDGEDLSVNERNFEDITVTYKQASSFFVTIPKTIVLDGWKQSTYSVKVSGDIDAEQCVYVAPVDMIDTTENIDFYMKDQAAENAKANVVASVTHNKFHWNSAEVAEGHKQDDNLVSAPDLTAGAWRGIFQMEIKLETHVAHKHNYVATITKEPTCTEAGEKTYTCTCGESYTEEIPAKGHHFENGECTVCGEKEADPYETAPASAYSNWDYTLDDENGIITLNYYKGAETDVIVYANYEIGGKTYKTQIASNSRSANTSTSYMFNGTAQAKCKNIKSIKFSDCIDTSNVVNMKNMFGGCTSLISLDISGFDTSNVTDINAMFFNCPSLTSLDLSNFDTSNVTNMSSMFQWCTGLTSLDLSGFNTSNVTNMGAMFLSCTSLTSVDLSSFDTKNVTKMDQMFDNCPKLTTIYATEGKWITSQANTRNMFDGCGTSFVTYK